MKLTIKDENDKKTFTQIFKHLNSFTELLNLRFEENRLYFQGMDQSHCALFELQLSKEWFGEYDVNESIVLGINIGILSKILGIRNKEQDIVLEMNDEEGDRLYVELESKTVLTKTFQIPIMDIDEELMIIPDVEYSVDFVCYSKKIEEIIKEMSIFGDSIFMEFTEDNMELSSTGDNGSMLVNINFEDLEEYVIEEGKKFKIEYAIKYFLWIMVFSDISDSVSIHASNKIPMKVHYPLGEENYIKFWLAPKFDDY
jgi:proliferating cell nuclear antigen